MFNKNFIVLIATALLLALMFLFMIISNLPQKSNESIYTEISPTITPIEGANNNTQLNLPDENPDYKKSVEIINTTEAPILIQEEKVGKLLDILPYKGQYFQMENDYQKNQIIVTIQKNKQNEGNTELTGFLQKNEINDQSWIRNLVVKYE